MDWDNLAYFQDYLFEVDGIEYRHPTNHPRLLVEARDDIHAGPCTAFCGMRRAVYSWSQGDPIYQGRP